MQVSAIANILIRQDPAGSIAVQSSVSSVSETQKEKLTEAKNVIGVLKQAATSRSDGQKVASRQKLELLKQQLQKMQLLGATPKQIAQMAGELAQAVKEYAAAGGTPSEVGSVPDDAGAASQANSALPPEPDDTADVSPAGSSPSNAATKSTGPSPAGLISDAIRSNADNSKTADGRQTVTQYDKTLNLKAESNRSAKTSKSDDGDRIFYSAARLLAKQLKGAAENVSKTSFRAHDTVDAIKAAEAATSAVDKAEALGQSGGLLLSA